MVAGPATGVREGKDFLEIGKFRIGAARYKSTTGQWDHLVVSHGTQTIQVYRDDGLRFGAVAWAGKVLAERPTQSHCGTIQATAGTCPGITAGYGFLQLGDWRLATFADHLHFSISHRKGATGEVVNADGTNEADVGNQDPFGRLEPRVRASGSSQALCFFWGLHRVARLSHRFCPSRPLE
ncbi:unnamed protein product [Symbiodinium sp. KB8]|nr:unnamed protein product [Symbiodinium sp. KB8]